MTNRQQALRRAWACLFSREATLRSCLLWLVLACVLPATFGAALLIAAAYRDGQAALYDRALRASGAMVQAVDDELRHATAALQILATSPSLAQGDLPAFHAQARQMLPLVGAHHVVLALPGGRQVLDTRVDFGGPLPASGAPAFEERAIASGHPQVSDLSPGRVVPAPLIVVAMPVQWDEGVRYGLAMALAPDRMTSLVAALRPEPDWGACRDKASIPL